MNNSVEPLISKSIEKLLKHSFDEKKINEILKKQEKKVHFIPIRYRILGGILQSLNIQFGNYIEELIYQIVENEVYLEILKKYSGAKNEKMHLTKDTDSLIDKYITNCQISYNPENLRKNFTKLLDDIINNQTNLTNKDNLVVKHDIDVLFKDNRTNIIYYLEIKYNDDHDTGKYVDINRKFLKTYAGLVNVLNISNKSDFIPIIYYLTPKIMKGNIYTPEETNIYRGARLFDEFFTITYNDLDRAMQNIGNDKKIINIFDDLYKKIRHELEINI